MVRRAHGHTATERREVVGGQKKRETREKRRGERVKGGKGERMEGVNEKRE